MPEARACPWGTFAKVKNPTPFPPRAARFQNLPNHEGGQLFDTTHLIATAIRLVTK